MINTNEHPKKDLPEAARNVSLAKTYVERAKKNLLEQVDLVEAALSANEAMKIALSSVRGEAIDFQDELPKILASVRMSRMALNTEITAALKSFEDLRKFFVNPDHEKEVERLAAFVDVCERLKSLKESGFLDVVADTILKLEKCA